MEEDSSFLHFLSSAVADEHFFYIFYLPPWRKSISFTFFIFLHGGRIFLLHFLSSAVAEERSFLILLFSAMADERSFSILLSTAVSDDRSFKSDE